MEDLCEERAKELRDIKSRIESDTKGLESTKTELKEKSLDIEALKFGMREKESLNDELLQKVKSLSTQIEKNSQDVS